MSTPTPTRRRFLALASLAGAGAGVSVLAPPALAAVGTPTSGTGATALAPLPPGAMGPALNADGYALEQIGVDLYWLGDGIYQMLFLVTAEGVVVVDAPPTIGGNIPRAISRVTKKPVTHVVYSHHHADHIAAASLFPDAQRVAHAETARLLGRSERPHSPLPTRTFRRSLTLTVGGQVLRLDHRGPNHTPDNIYIWAPRQRTLMLVDVVFPGWVPFKQLAVSQDVPGWIRAHDEALTYPFTTYVGGHLTRPGTRADVLTQRAYVHELRALSRRAIETFDPTPIFSRQPPGNSWAIFDDYLDSLSTLVGRQSAARWVDRLGGADVFAADNAFSMIESLRIDSGVLGPFGLRP